MTLAQFMKLHGLDDIAMAKAIGDCSEHAVKKWRYGERTPRPEQMARIKVATDDQVTPNDFLPSSPSAPSRSEAAA